MTERYTGWSTAEVPGGKRKQDTNSYTNDTYEVLGFTPTNAPQQKISIVPDPPHVLKSLLGRKKSSSKKLRKVTGKARGTKRNNIETDENTSPLITQLPQTKRIKTTHQDHKTLDGTATIVADTAIEARTLYTTPTWDAPPFLGRSTDAVLSPILEEDEPECIRIHEGGRAPMKYRETRGPDPSHSTPDEMQFPSAFTSSDTMIPDSEDEYGTIDDNDLNALGIYLDDDGDVPMLAEAFSNNQISSDTVVPSECGTKRFSNSGLNEECCHSAPCPPDRVEGHNDGINEFDVKTTDQVTPDHLEVRHELHSGRMLQLRNKTQKPFTSPIKRTPFVRAHPPKPIRDRSPVIGVSSAIVLRTCFRLGEAINYGGAAIRNNQDVVIELYARIAASDRGTDGVKQKFVLWDLFHSRQPHLIAYYDLWTSSELWDFESGAFLEAGLLEEKKLCRCMGRMKRIDNHLRFMILNIWEASWDDVEHVKGIVSPEDP